jgi:hypothetical protein
MSWDVLLMKEKFDLEDVPDDFRPQKLGKRDDIIAKLQLVIPELDYSDKSWGMLDTSEYSIEFNTGRNEEVDSIMLHIRGRGDPLIIIKLICETFGWAALDCSTGDFMDLENLSSESWVKFQEYRDRVLKQYK